MSQPNSETSLIDTIQITEEAILNAIESSQALTFDIDYTHPITIEIGASDRPQQDNSLALGKYNF